MYHAIVIETCREGLKRMGIFTELKCWCLMGEMHVWWSGEDRAVGSFIPLPLSLFC